VLSPSTEKNISLAGEGARATQALASKVVGQ